MKVYVMAIIKFIDKYNFSIILNILM